MSTNRNNATDWELLENPKADANVTNIEYSPSTRQMMVTFNNGRKWLYSNVIKIHFDALKECAKPDSTVSVSKYFASIRTSLTGAEFTDNNVSNVDNADITHIADIP